MDLFFFLPRCPQMRGYGFKQFEMRHIILLIFILVHSVAVSQTASPISQNSKYYEYKNAVRVDSAFFLPRKDTLTTDISLLAPGMIVYRPADSLIYYRKGAAMTRLSSAGDLSAYYTKLESDARYLPLSNPVISTNSAIITNIGPTAQGQNHYALNNGGINRIGLGLITTESGGNAGSNFYISRYDDAGVSIGFPLIARRTDGRITFEITPYVSNNPIWHAGNQGAGTGMDADLLDGQHGTYYTDFSNQTNKPGLNTVMDVSRTANDPNEYALIGNVTVGKSATGYGTIGYGFLTTSTTNTYNYANNDVAIMADFLNGGFNIRSAPSGTMGNPITFVDRLNIPNTGAIVAKGTSSSVGNALTVQNSSGAAVLEVANNGDVYMNGLRYTSGSGSPEGTVAAPVGSWYSDLANGIPYFKKTGTGNTGWKAVTLAP